MKTIKNRNINGRPTLEAAEKKGYKISVRLSTDEYYDLKAKAQTAGMDMSQYIRKAIQGSQVKERMQPEQYVAIRQLRGMGNNINQIAHEANRAGYRSDMARIEEIEVTIDNIRKILLRDR